MNIRRPQFGNSQSLLIIKDSVVSIHCVCAFIGPMHTLPHSTDNSSLLSPTFVVDDVSPCGAESGQSSKPRDLIIGRPTRPLGQRANRPGSTLTKGEHPGRGGDVEHHGGGRGRR